MFKESLQHTDDCAGDPGQRSFSSICSAGLQKCRQNFWEDNLGMCAFWGPADIVIYSVPLWLRMPLNHAISFAWVSVVSFWRGDS